jgi:cell division protein FtsZ
MGSAETSGENRARRAAEAAINSPLLNNQNINGAKKILLSIVSGQDAELQMDELTEITDYMQESAGDEAEVIFGHGIDANLGQNIRVTVIATGFETPDEMTVRLKGEDEVFEAPRFKPEPIITPKKVDEREVFDLESSKGLSQYNIFGQDSEKKSREVEWEITSKRVEEEPEEEEKSEVAGDLDFEFDFEERKLSKEEIDDITFDFEKAFDVVDDEPEQNEFDEEEDFKLEELNEMAHPFSKKLQLIKARKQREEAIEQTRQRKELSTESFKEKWEVPAYERKKVALTKVPHSSEANISKYNLSDDNQLVGNNRFLHDNVD